MSTPKIVETIYGRYYKYEIVEEITTWSIKFYIYRDGKYYRGSFKYLYEAVEAAKKEG